MRLTTLSTRIPETLLTELETRAKEHDKTLSDYVRDVLAAAVSGDVSHTLKQLLHVKYCVLRLAEKQHGEQVAAQIRDAARADAEQALSMLRGGK